MRGLMMLLMLVSVAAARAEVGTEPATDGQENGKIEVQKTPAEARSRKTRFNFRFGALFANQINTGVQVNSRKIPILGSYIDTENTLGMLNSETVPMLNLAYRIKANHLISLGWFKLNRNSTIQVQEEINIGDIVIPVGAEVNSLYNTEYFKLKYNYVFFNHPKVKLTIGAGLHVTRIDFGISVTGLIDGKLNTGGTAPLPMIGGVMVYTFTPKLRLALRLDQLFVSYGDYQGAMNESNAVIEYQAFERIGFGFGVTRFNLDVNLDNDKYYARFTNSYQGFTFYTSLNF